MATTYIRRIDGKRAPAGARMPGGASFGGNRSSSSRSSGSSSSGSSSGHGDSRGSRSYSSNRSSSSRSYSSRGPSSGYGNRGGSRSGGRTSSSKRGYQEINVDLSKLINKAKEVKEEVFVPEHQFADFEIEQVLKDNIAERGYVTPTPIQDQSIPHVLHGEDIVGIANTGTGKTASFLIPLINKVLKDRSQRMLIMVPTRELALQIEQEFYGFSKRLNINAVCCVGGANIMPQIRVLHRKPNFVIGTPGRLKDLMERGDLELSHFQTVVLDEADRMLDMGFIQDMRFIMAKMSKDRHTLFFSATLSREIELLIHEFLNKPARVSVKTRDTAQTIDQDVVRINGGESKFDVLADMLKNPEFNKVLVFGRTKHGVERLARDLSARGISADSIHGDKTHGRRQKALTLFKQNHVNVLVATDVAARGLDISGVSHVINYDLPATYEDYTHRIGRTGRAGKAGKALTFI
jgi:ATP-dependent RNA helicase RhlE